jgi:hypothetical protein
LWLQVAVAVASTPAEKYELKIPRPLAGPSENNELMAKLYGEFTQAEDSQLVRMQNEMHT